MRTRTSGLVSSGYPGIRVAVLLVLTGSCSGTRPALPVAQPDEIGLSAEALAAIRPALQAYVDSGRLAGITALVARHGRIGYEQSVGWMDIEQRIPMRRDAVFRIFSMTKPVLAAGAVRLIEQRRLGLEDPVAKYIPEFARVKVYAGGSARNPVVEDPDSVMRVRHLLTHTAGLGYGIGEAPLDTVYQRASLFDAGRTVEQFLGQHRAAAAVFLTGQRVQVQRCDRRARARYRGRIRNASRPLPRRAATPASGYA